MDIDALFSPGGALSASDGRYEDRPQQRRMAQAVAGALQSGRHLVVEAGTGVGKSLAYLLPGALWAVNNDRRLLVSTHTRALQEQIMSKELPLAAAALSRFGLTLRYAMLQGADNYLCLQRLERARSQPALFSDSASRALDRAAEWSRTAATGHRSALPELLPHSVWSRVSRDSDVCLGPQGSFWKSCLWRKDRERAERAHVLVVNHALLLSGARLPPHDAIVVDEAHSLEEAAVSRYGTAVTELRVSRLLDEARALIPAFEPLGTAIAKAAAETAEFFAAAAAAHELPASDESGARLLGLDAPPPPRAWSELESACLKLIEAGTSSELEMELRLLHSRLSGLRSDAGHIVGAADDGCARWIERGPAGIALKLAPLDVSQRLAEGLFSRGVPAILTSATLSGRDGLCDFRAAVGLGPAEELVVDSPFDYSVQAALLLDGEMPAPTDKKYVAALARKCAEVVDQVPGGVFLLFSSWKTLRQVRARLKRRIKDRPIWVQGDAGHDALISEFQAAGNAVLLGVDTFWQGVDVPGEALSCVVLTKLPFGNVGSPVEEARRSWYQTEGRDYFRDFSLPRAVMKFRQGFGRLIRSAGDRGAVVVLDSRVVKKGYGHAFLQALPRCRRLESVSELGSFFAERPSAALPGARATPS